MKTFVTLVCFVICATLIAELVNHFLPKGNCTTEFALLVFILGLTIENSWRHYDG